MGFIYALIARKNMSDQITTVKQLLSDPKKWTKEYYALNIDGEFTDSNSSQAVCWCLIGAIRKVYDKENYFIMMAKVREKLGELHGHWDIVHFNTNTNHEGLMKLVELSGV